MNGKTALQTCLRALKGEVVLVAALALAVISAFFVTPDAEYIGYIDWNTITLLFSLMAVTKSLQSLGAFDRLGAALLRRTTGTRQMMLVLVFLPFLFSMLITNDVALITFVPFGMTVLRLADCRCLVTPLVVLQTLAANLGSMLTPMGNPQNLYLYTKSGMGFGAFCALMLPYVAVSAVCLALLAGRGPSLPVQPVSLQAAQADKKALAVCGIGFGLCLLSILKLLPAPAVALVTAVWLVLRDRQTLARIDYALLGTFAGFFVFIGNMGRIPWFRDLIASVLTGHELIAGVVSSQVISNVPAALLLSGYSNRWAALIVGCNLGGLGTLIASMASLISYKLVAREYPDQRGGYFARFTVYNIAMLALLLALAAVLGALA